MIRSTACAKLAIIMLTAVALAGCGRKGPLELPPSASVQPQSNTARSEVAPPPQSSVATQAGALFAPPGEEPAPAARPAGRRPFFLDFILD
ncbi:MAG: hypothetical protein A4S14_21115 [Proteobacteria bacterium SG_bin9]|nr:MAG: hypothetical protein A4S14_21115 [Proteobacteria bacterium SG_bin9]